MRNYPNWLSLPALIWILSWTSINGIYGQSENAIGAHRVYEKTSFSCAGRPAGYYADVETGCQVYHMCDGLGRQFSYSCPNTTLFQQRMLICDHWYMVNCSKAESNYAANLLIGQRDKPFVNDEENNLRTPRPDLLDRPYAPDYEGESFRNQYKQLPAAQNQIDTQSAQKNRNKFTAQTHHAVGQQSWKIPPPPSRLILPPSHESDLEANSTILGQPKTQTSSKNINVRYVPTTPVAAFRRYTAASTATTTTTTTTTTRRPTAAATQRRQSFNSFNSAALHQRQQESLHADADDLGTSHSTRYNTSADFNSAEVPSQNKQFNGFNNRRAFVDNASSSSSTTTTTKRPATKEPIKVPSKIYEPPFVYPIYNQNDTTFSSTETPLIVSTATPFRAASTTRSTTIATTTRAPSRPTTLAGKPFSAPIVPITAVPSNVGRNQNNLLQQQYQPNQRFDAQRTLLTDARTPTPAQGFKPPTPRPPINTAKTLKPINTDQNLESSALDYKVPTASRLGLPNADDAKPELPSNDLLPPHQEFVQHDIATTQGPPIYYEWKIPSHGLEPPKLEAPYGVDGREYPEMVIDYNTISASGAFSPAVSKGAKENAVKSTGVSNSPKFGNNPFLPVKPNSDNLTSRTPTSRSIKDTAQPSNSVFKSSTTKTAATNTKASAEPASDITQLRKDLSVPEYAFPLEDIGRTGYLSTGTYNSFQLKIPERRNDADAKKLHWFGENPKCPECHPSYVKPGTCEPCLRR